MLRAVVNKSWRDHLKNEQIYSDIPKSSESMQRLKFGHYWISKDEVKSHLILWQPHHGNCSRGRQAKTYIYQLRDDTDLLTIDEINTAMNNRERSRSTW